MGKFLVCVDGSKASDAAAQKAKELAKPGDEVIILCVVDFTHYILSQPLSVESDVGFAELKQRMVAQGEDVTNKYKKLAESNSPDVSYKFELLQGNPREVILQYTLDNKIDTLVIGQVGLTSSKRTALGSTSDYCLRNCSCDVLICKFHESLFDD